MALYNSLNHNQRLALTVIANSTSRLDALNTLISLDPGIFWLKICDNLAEYEYLTVFPDLSMLDLGNRTLNSILYSLNDEVRELLSSFQLKTSINQKDLFLKLLQSKNITTTQAWSRILGVAIFDLKLIVTDGRSFRFTPLGQYLKQNPLEKYYPLS